jgi:hypothetical protein
MFEREHSLWTSVILSAEQISSLHVGFGVMNRIMQMEMLDAVVKLHQGRQSVEIAMWLVYMLRARHMV